VAINVPVFRDTATPWPFHDPTIDYTLKTYPEDADVRNGAAREGCIYMDAMAFGMGSCCLQITFQAKNVDEGRRMYDQLSPLGPIMLALTAATPMYKGFLADTDARWNQISDAVDDRTAEELGEKVRFSAGCSFSIRCFSTRMHELTVMDSPCSTTAGASPSPATPPTAPTSRLHRCCAPSTTTRPW